MTAPATVTVRYDRWRKILVEHRDTIYTHCGIIDWKAVDQDGKPLAFGKYLPHIIKHVRLTFVDDIAAAEFALRYV